MPTLLERDYTAKLLSKGRLIQILKISKDSFPRDLEYSILFSKANAYVLSDIVSVDVYLVENN